MRHYPHPYQETPNRGLLSSVVMLLVLGVLLAGSRRVYARMERRRLGRASTQPPLSGPSGSVIDS